MLKTWKIFVLLLSIFTTAQLVVAKDGGKDGEFPIQSEATSMLTNQPSKSTSVKPSTETSSTSKATTTSTATTTITKATTVAPKTTTTVTTAKTTTVPITTSTPSTKPTTPAPVPNPTAHTWTANFTGTNRTCVVVQAALRLDIVIKVGNDTEKLPINVPVDATSTGDCDSLNIQSISMNWTARTDASNQLTFTFKRNDSKFELSEIDVTLNLTTVDKPGYVMVYLIHKKTEFNIPTRKSYKCEQEQSLKFDPTDGGVNATLQVSHVQMEAFRNVTGTKFNDALNCVDAKSTDVVPIAVGCGLVTLVLIVLIGYLIGRRRSQARGYLSMFTENKREREYIPMKRLSCFN